MCGIVGILGREPVAGQLVDALKRLEYRGYDSTGVATLEAGHLTRRRAEGKLKNLETRLLREPLSGTIGIGHTRWATHGRPNETNAHPHATDVVAVVHNGIIENFRELRDELEAQGAQFKTETDSEVVAHLVTAEVKAGRSPLDAVAVALAPFTDTISYLEDGDYAALRRSGVEIHDAAGRIVKRPVIRSMASAFLVDKGNHRHFMAKEIYEQPEVVGHTLAHYLDMSAERVALPAKLPFDFHDIGRVSISACGTAYYAGLVAKYWFERLARLPAEIDFASEFRYRGAP